MLAAGEEGKWKEFLPSMGTEAHIPKLFKSSSKARCRSQQRRAWPVYRDQKTCTASTAVACAACPSQVWSMSVWGAAHASARQGPVGDAVSYLSSMHAAQA